MTLKKISDLIKKKSFLIAIVFIILAGSFLRIYHFNDWIHFETDQTDDYLITSPAIQNGIENLKLLGPRAGAEELRIGPAYYYIEYLGGKIFGNTPQGHAAPNLILAIAAMPLFFVFARLYFSRIISASLLVLYATSFYLIQYARFSWNPNVLPFFVLATFYLLLRSVSPEEKRRDVFFIFSLTILSIISQLHFNGLFIIVPAYVIFLLIKRPHFPIKTWVYAILFSILIYSPIILHELKYDFSNSKLLIEKISGNSKEKEKSEEKNVSEKIVQNLRYNSGEFFLILTGEDRINTSRPNGYSLGILCNACKEDRIWRLSALFLYIASVLLLGWNIKKEKNKTRKDFLILSALWLSIGSAYFISLTLNKLYIYPRFYLVLAPLAFILLGLIFEKIIFRKKLINTILIVAITLLIAIINSTKISDSFWQLKNSQQIAVKIETEDVFPNYYRAPLFIHQKISDYIEQQVPNKNTKIFISSESEYEPIYWIILQNKGYNYFNEFDDEKPSEVGEYFSIQLSANKKKNDSENFSDFFDIIEVKDFGIMKVTRLKPKVDVAYDTNINTVTQKRSQVSAIEKMHSWKDLFQDSTLLNKVPGIKNIYDNELRTAIITDIDHCPSREAASTEKLDAFIDFGGEKKADFMISLGDNASHRLRSCSTTADMDARFIADYLRTSTLPTHFVLGDHDIESDIKSYQNWLETVKKNETFYSFDLKNFHIIVLDTVLGGEPMSLSCQEDAYCTLIENRLSELNKIAFKAYAQKYADAKKSIKEEKDALNSILQEVYDSKKITRSWGVRDRGQILEKELAWLAADINATQHSRVLVFSDHPLFKFASQKKVYDIANGDKAREILEKSGKEIVAISGEAHLWHEEKQGNIQYYIIDEFRKSNGSWAYFTWNKDGFRLEKETH
ncbi:MAG: hypothetical protein US70_C0002G0004 [Parcubacteria group bacterium GW2011_GWD2_38_11]|nr:MAG: hypothetical protein US70_C0002G0004 [Parcubacteria group bacterium GW2011_GWD2_38_11]